MKIQKNLIIKIFNCIDMSISHQTRCKGINDAQQHQNYVNFNQIEFNIIRAASPATSLQQL